MTIEFYKELDRAVEQNPTHILQKVIDEIVIKHQWGRLDKQLQAHLLMALARIEELKAEEES